MTGEEQEPQWIKALRRNDVSAVDRHLKAFPSEAEWADEKGVIPAFIAAEAGHFEMLRYLMEYSRTSMNVWDREHRSILHYAAKGGNRELFAYLVERIGMEPLETDLCLQTPADTAREAGAKEILQYYRETLGIDPDRLYRNPVVQGAHPDPSVIRVGEDYYMVTSSFTLFPCIPVLHSRDLIHWRTIGHGISDPSFIDLSGLDDGRGFWAPDISFHKGVFTIVATLRFNDEDDPVRSQAVMQSRKPEGPYSKPVCIEEDGIDPSVFTDDDGASYMLLNRGARIFPLSPDRLRKTGEAQMLWYGAQKRAPEAPHLLKKDGWYYLFVSEGGTGRNHQISVARSRDLWGPYQACPFNPILTQKDPEHPIQRSGHGKLFSTPDGRWFMLYLCSRMADQKYSIMGRESGLDEVQWTADGWPMVNGLKGPSGAALRPFEFPGLEEKRSDPLNFASEKLSPEWISPRSRNAGSFTLLQDRNALLIRGGEDLSSPIPGGLILLRQKSFRFRFECSLELDVSSSGGEAGLSGYYDRSTWLSFGLTGSGHLRVTEQEGEERRIPFEFPWEGSAIQLRLETDIYRRSFYFRPSQKENWQLLGELPEVTYLSDEGGKGKRFTGALFGLYCLGAEAENPVSAIFSRGNIKLFP